MNVTKKEDETPSWYYELSSQAVCDTMMTSTSAIKCLFWSHTFDGWFNLHCFHCGINGSLRCVMGNFVGNETHTTFRSVNSSSKEAENTINIILMECCWQHLKKNLLVPQFHSLQELTKIFWRGSFLYDAFMPIWYVISSDEYNIEIG